jgi:hypothetical protein
MAVRHYSLPLAAVLLLVIVCIGTVLLMHQHQSLLLDDLHRLLPREDPALPVRVRHLLVLPRVCEHPSVRRILSAAPVDYLYLIL